MREREREREREKEKKKEREREREKKKKERERERDREVLLHQVGDSGGWIETAPPYTWVPQSPLRARPQQ